MLFSVLDQVEQIVVSVPLAKGCNRGWTFLFWISLDKLDYLMTDSKRDIYSTFWQDRRMRVKIRIYPHWQNSILC